MPNEPRWTSHLGRLAIPFAVACVVYAGALHTWFAQDDLTFIARARGLVPGGGWFRPLSETAAFRFENAAFGLDPLGYHVVNLALHLLAVAGVYALAWLLLERRGAAQAAAFVFAIASIAFTPLHAATGVVELLPCVLLLAATCVHVVERRAGRAWSWWAAVPAAAAAGAKETALAWPLVVLAIEAGAGRFPRSRRALVPALVVAALGVVVLVATHPVGRIAHSTAYAVEASPAAIASNLLTYARWCVPLGDPIRDARTAADPSAWPWGLVVMVAIAALLLRPLGPGAGAARVGVVWWLAFLAPVLPFTRHAYLYYLYVPWAGAAIALAAWGADAAARLPGRGRSLAAAAVALLAIGIEWHNVDERERRTRDALPVDRTMRDAMLLEHAIAGVRAAVLPAGARVGFVNPAPRPRFDLVTGAPTRGEDLARRTSYWPLEAAMNDGLALRLFFPTLRYAGFATAIPAEWTDVDCFLFEQRGWLVHWGRGAAARAREADWLARGGSGSAPAPPR